MKRASHSCEEPGGDEGAGQSWLRAQHRDVPGEEMTCELKECKGDQCG